MVREFFLALSAATLIAIGGLVAAQSAKTQTAMHDPEAAATDATAAASAPDRGTSLRLATLDTSDEAFRKLDKDQDGRLSPLEAADNPELAAAFTIADKNKDGYLSLEEFKGLSSASGHQKASGH